MNWYYATGQDRRGPVSGEQFQELVSTGQITPQTLVWNESMTAWQAWGSLQPPAIAAAAPGPLAPIPLAPLPTAPAPSMASPAESFPAMEPGLVYANFWQRAAARIIDQILMALIALPIVVLIAMAIFYQRISSGSLDMENPMVNLVIQFVTLGVFSVVVLPYQTISIGRWGQTMGKRLLGIEVVMPDGSRPSYACALGRSALEFLLLNCTCCLGYLVMLFDNQNRTLQDFACNTRVVRKR